MFEEPVIKIKIARCRILYIKNSYIDIDYMLGLILSLFDTGSQYSVMYKKLLILIILILFILEKWKSLLPK